MGKQQMNKEQMENYRTDPSKEHLSTAIPIVYKRKKNMITWIIIPILSIIIFSIVCLYYSIWPTFLFNFIPLFFIYYNYSKEKYCIQENGTLKITTIWRSRAVLSGLSRVTYRPSNWNEQTIRIDHAQGFTFINPEHPERFISDLKAVNKELIVIERS